LQNELEVVAGMIQQAIGENAHFALDQGEYQERYDGLVDRFDLAKARHTAVTEEIADKQTRLSSINAFLYTLRRHDNLLTEFDEKLWCSLVDYATVYDKDNVRFTFKDGTKIKV
jgi:site-specific DNA recombinase